MLAMNARQLRTIKARYLSLVTIQIVKKNLEEMSYIIFKVVFLTTYLYKIMPGSNYCFTWNSKIHQKW